MAILWYLSFIFLLCLRPSTQSLVKQDGNDALENLSGKFTTTGRIGKRLGHLPVARTAVRELKGSSSSSKKTKSPGKGSKSNKTKSPKTSKSKKSKSPKSQKSKSPKSSKSSSSSSSSSSSGTVRFNNARKGSNHMYRRKTNNGDMMKMMMQRYVRHLMEPDNIPNAEHKEGFVRNLFSSMSMPPKSAKSNKSSSKSESKGNMIKMMMMQRSVRNLLESDELPSAEDNNRHYKARHLKGSSKSKSLKTKTPKSKSKSKKTKSPKSSKSKKTKSPKSSKSKKSKSPKSSKSSKSPKSSKSNSSNRGGTVRASAFRNRSSHFHRKKVVEMKGNHKPANRNHKHMNIKKGHNMRRRRSMNK